MAMFVKGVNLAMKMKNTRAIDNVTRALLFFILQVSSFSLLLADTHYVDIASTNATPPYTNWTTAAKVIQDAIDWAVSNDTVLVADGVYSNGGVAVYGSMTNRVAITNAIFVRSVNGPDFTFIVGKGVGINGASNGSGAVRCAYMTNGAAIAGFTLTNGHTCTSGDTSKEQSGGGVWCQSIAAVISNCVIRYNSAESDGGGSWYGTFNNCMISGNSARTGGGAIWGLLANCVIIGNSASQSGGGSFGGTLYNCVLNGNSAEFGGGSADGILYNCVLSGNNAEYGGGSSFDILFNSIIYYNSAVFDWNYVDGGIMEFCCSTPLPYGKGNTSTEPGIVSISNPRLLPVSVCINAGTNQAWMETEVDIDGETRLNGIVDIGVDEFNYWGLAGSLSAAATSTYASVAVGFGLEFSCEINGRPVGYEWNWGDGGVTRNLFQTRHAFATAGVFQVILTASNLDGSVSATVTVSVVEESAAARYVSLSGSHVYPFDTWTNAATNLQAAVDAGIVGSTVWVTNGVYNTGGKAVYGSMTNRVAVVDKPLAVRSVNGPEYTFIVGEGVGVGGTNCGNGAVRCAYLRNGSVLTGFTLTNGHTRTSGDSIREQSGGGVWCENGAIISNCAFSRNNATNYGGGSYNGTLYNCALSDNRADNCGGGSYLGTLFACVLSGNSASYGGGTGCGVLYNCVIEKNSAIYGGGSSWGTLYNCVLSKNSVSLDCGGAYGGMLQNCIVYYNSAGRSGQNYLYAMLSGSCATPLPGGEGNITNAPMFVDIDGGDYRLQFGSPCMDRGLNQDWMYGASDMKGIPRIINGVVDLGAYEFHFDGNLRSYLQGPYDANAHAMKSILTTNIPSPAPYAVDRKPADSMPSNAVDWILLQIRPGTTNSPAVSRSLFLRNDGMITDAAGDTNILIEVSPMSTNCLVISHRNHLSVMSAQPLVFTNQLMTYDFTTNWTCYYGGTNACVELEPGVWGMIAGDADGDGKITATDRKIVEQQAGKIGYLPGDLNLDGVVTTNEP